MIVNSWNSIYRGAYQQNNNVLSKVNLLWSKSAVNECKKFVCVLMEFRLFYLRDLLLNSCVLSSNYLTQPPLCPVYLFDILFAFSCLVLGWEIVHSKCKFIRCRLRKTHVRRKMAEIKNHKSKVLNKSGGKLSKQKKKCAYVCLCFSFFFFATHLARWKPLITLQ